MAASRLAEQYRALDCPEVGLSVLFEHVCDSLVFAGLDQVVDVDGLPVETTRERSGYRGLARAHESDQVNLVCLHAISRSSVSKNVGYEIPTTSAPSMRDGAVAPRAAIANAIAMR